MAAPRPARPVPATGQRLAPDGPFTNCVREQREASGRSRRWVKENIGLSYGQQMNLERHRVQLTKSLAHRYAKGLGIAPVRLFANTGRGNGLPMPVEANEPIGTALVPHIEPQRTGKGQVQKLGIALTYDGQIIGAASVNLDMKALSPLIKRMMREALED